MEFYDSMELLEEAVQAGMRQSQPDSAHYLRILRENGDLIRFLRFLETANPCGQRYFLHSRVILISYVIRYDLIRLGRRHAVRGRYRAIGLPVSLSCPGYLIASGDDETRHAIGAILREAADSMKGITIVMNADSDIHGGRLSPSTFVFHNSFSGFEQYLEALRSSYRRKLNAVLEKGRDLSFTKVARGGFTQAHYDLYLSVCERSSRVFRILPFEYFRDAEAEVVEARDRQGNLLAMVQLMPIDTVLYFVYVGFRRDEVEAGDSTRLKASDLYFNLLLFIIRYGIEQGYRKVVFGQTSAESKSKVGCAEELKYIYVTSSNPLIRAFFRLFPGLYSSKPYRIDHAVFKVPARLAAK